MLYPKVLGPCEQPKDYEGLDDQEASHNPRILSYSKPGKSYKAADNHIPSKIEMEPPGSLEQGSAISVSRINV